MSDNELWNSEEFEDLVARSLIGLYETKIKEEKKGAKHARFTKEVFERVRNFGLYFPVNDRFGMMKFDDNDKASAVQQIDMINDGLPDRAILSSNPEQLQEHEYLWSFYIERVKFLPPPYKAPRKGKIYRAHQIYFGNTQVEGCGTFVVIDSEGYIESCYIPGYYRDPITKRVIPFENRPHQDEPMPGALDFYSGWSTIAIQLYQDRRHLWNVTAKEGIAKATFTVYEEQIKSLFYSRELPETATGRKRPILHWVKSHRKRIKEGDDFDVQKYLRGSHEFIMDGTKFEITNPTKDNK